MAATSVAVIRTVAGTRASVGTGAFWAVKAVTSASTIAVAAGVRIVVEIAVSVSVGVGVGDDTSILVGSAVETAIAISIGVHVAVIFAIDVAVGFCIDDERCNCGIKRRHDRS